MNVVELNRYAPSVFKRARFLESEWGSVSDIGKVFHGNVLTVDEYLWVEESYVKTILHLLELAGASDPQVSNLEHWVEEPEYLPLGARGVLPLCEAPREGDHLSGDKLEGAIRRCLRETAWLEFVRPRDFLIHDVFGLSYLGRLDMLPNVDHQEQVSRWALVERVTAGSWLTSLIGTYELRHFYDAESHTLPSHNPTTAVRNALSLGRSAGRILAAASGARTLLTYVRPEYMWAHDVGGALEVTGLSARGHSFWVHIPPGRIKRPLLPDAGTHRVARNAVHRSVPRERQLGRS